MIRSTLNIRALSFKSMVRGLAYRDWRAPPRNAAPACPRGLLPLSCEGADGPFAGPMVRIRLSPAESLQTFGSRSRRPADYRTRHAGYGVKAVAWLHFHDERTQAVKAIKPIVITATPKAMSRMSSRPYMQDPLLVRRTQPVPFYQIAGLANRSTQDLRVAWRQLHRTGPPIGLSRDLLIRALVIVIDDPLKPEEALSDARRQAANEWYDHTLYSRLNDKRRGAIVIVMQRLHEDDLVGHVLEQEPWEVLRFPAIAEED